MRDGWSRKWMHDGCGGRSEMKMMMKKKKKKRKRWWRVIM